MIKFDKLLAVLNRIGYYGLTASVLFMLFFPRIFALVGFPLWPSTAILLNQISTIGVGVFLVLLILTLILEQVLLVGKKNRSSVATPALPQRRDQPPYGPVYLPTSLLCLSWQCNYNQYLRENLTLKFMNPLTWMASSIPGILLCVIIPSNVFPGIPAWLAESVTFLAGCVLSAAFTALDCVLKVRSKFNPLAATFQFSLIVDVACVRLITGNQVHKYRWSEIGRVWKRNAVVFQRPGSTVLIPSYVFHSARDKKAFVHMLHALKKGLRPPAYNWSAYVPDETKSEAVWPPPIL
jgi:hypothetical protein